MGFEAAQCLEAAVVVAGVEAGGQLIMARLAPLMRQQSPGSNSLEPYPSSTAPIAAVTCSMSAMPSTRWTSPRAS